MINDSLQIAAKEVAIFRLAAPLQRPCGIIRFIAIGKALGKDLVKHRVFHPLRRTLQINRMQERELEQA
ncbi:hypothetical protein D3C81_1317830 [compost metagenome]